MVKSFLTRLWGIPALLCIGFFLLELLPESSSNTQKVDSETSFSQQDAHVKTTLPTFYFSISNSALPDTLNLITSSIRKNALKKVILITGEVDNNLENFRRWENLIAIYCSSGKTEFPEACNGLRMALNSNIPQVREKLAFKALKELNREHEFLRVTQKRLNRSIDWFIPSFQWHSENALHRYLWGDKNGNKGLLRGDLGKSEINGMPVLDLLLSRLPVTLKLASITLLLSLFLALGPWALIYFYGNEKKWFKFLAELPVLIMVIPSFLVATGLLMFFSNPYMFNFFPTGGLASHTNHLIHKASFWVLPIITMTIGTHAYIMLIAKHQFDTLKHAAHLKTANAKGLKAYSVFFKHVWRNSLPGIFTPVTQLLPGLFSGSVVVEYIFSLPGIGQLGLQALSYKDVPVLVALILFSGVVSMFAYALGDILIWIWEPISRERRPNEGF